MLVNTVFGDSTHTKSLSYEAWDAEDLLKSFKILKLNDSCGNIMGHELAFKVGLCSAVQCYLGEGYNSRLFNQLFVTSSQVEGHTYSYLVCGSSLLPALSAINGLPLEIKLAEQTLKASDSKIYLEDKQADDCLSLAPEASGIARYVRAQSAFQKLFNILPDGLQLGEMCLSTSAFTLLAKIEENPERLRAAKMAVALAKKIGDLNLYHKALVAASKISEDPKIREELEQIEQMIKLIAQGISPQGRANIDEQFSSMARPSFWLAGTPVYEPAGNFSRGASPLFAQSTSSSGLVTPGIQLLHMQLRGSRNDLEAVVPTVLSVNQANLQNPANPHSPVFVQEV